VVDEAMERRDPTLPRWATARLTRLFRDVDASERSAVVERLCGTPTIPARIADDVRLAAERASGPAPAVALSPPPAPARLPSATRQRASRPPSSSGRGVKTSTFKGRALSDVPAGIGVEYQGKHAVVEPPFLVLDDGRKFQFLNPAAAYVNGGIEINGWDAWKVADGRSMAECYDSANWPSAE
jgi:hypothetical protein